MTANPLGRPTLGRGRFALAMRPESDQLAILQVGAYGSTGGRPRETDDTGGRDTRVARLPFIRGALSRGNDTAEP